MTTTVVGNLTADPELRFVPSGQPVASFTIAETSRYLDRNTNEWKDGDSVFLRCEIWGSYAENVAESLQRGMRVVAVGQLRTRSFETREGETRSVTEMKVSDIGPALRYATAKVNKVQRGSQSAEVEDPWGSAPEQPPADEVTNKRRTRSKAPATS